MIVPYIEENGNSNGVIVYVKSHQHTTWFPLVDELRACMYMYEVMFHCCCNDKRIPLGLLLKVLLINGCVLIWVWLHWLCSLLVVDTLLCWCPALGFCHYPNKRLYPWSIGNGYDCMGCIDHWRMNAPTMFINPLELVCGLSFLERISLLYLHECDLYLVILGFLMVS